jgi:hypothetical protein
MSLGCVVGYVYEGRHSLGGISPRGMKTRTRPLEEKKTNNGPLDDKVENMTDEAFWKAWGIIWTENV